MEFSEVVRRRRMVRSFLPDPVPQDALHRIMAAARRAPSAGFTQGQSFVVVQDGERRQAIATISNEPAYLTRGFTPWISTAPVHVVCCVSEAAYHDRYREPDKVLPGEVEREWPVPFWYVDAGCALMLLLTAVVDEGLAAGFLGWSDEQTSAIRQLLAIPVEVQPIGLVTIGYPAPDRPSSSLSRGWKPEPEVVRWERYGE